MELVHKLKDLVEINSTYPYENQLGEYLFRMLTKKGLKTTKQYIDKEKKRFNILAERGNGGKSILLYAHLDTVGVAAGWKTNPLELTVVGNKAYGLGVWDMKAGLAVSLDIFIRFLPKNMKLKLALCVDEEYISTGGHALISSRFMKDVGCVVSTEPAFQNGLQGIVTGRIGRAVYDGSITTKSRHFALYEPAYDINTVYAGFIRQLQKLYKKSGDKKQFVFVRSVESHVTGMSLPSRTAFQLDSSVLHPQTHMGILGLLQKIARDLEKKYGSHFSIAIDLHERPTPFLEPYEVTKNNKFLQLLKRSVKVVTKKNAIPYFRSSVADENIFGAAGIPTLGIGPVGGNAHGANEWVNIASVQELMQILHHFISRADEL